MQRKKPDTAAVALYDIAFRHGTAAIGILFALAMDLGLQTSQRCRRLSLVEHNDVVHHFERREHFRPILLAHQRPTRTFELSRARIAVDADDENIAQSFRIAQTADVSGMQQIENAIRPDDRLALCTPFGAHGNKFVHRS